MKDWKASVCRSDCTFLVAFIGLCRGGGGCMDGAVGRSGGHGDPDLFFTLAALIVSSGFSAEAASDDVS